MTNRKPTRVRKRTPRTLVTNRLENVSKEVFRRYFPLITELIGDSPGIYALYDGADLYYVGKSVELRKRVRHHLKDRHLASWTHFSLYLVRREEHIGEIESLLVRIANPKGNRLIPRGRSTGALVTTLRQLIQDRQKQELADLFDTKRAAGRVSTTAGRASGRTLEGLVDKRTALYRTYKGRELTAWLSPGGFITVKGKRFASASASAKAAMRVSRAVNGWTFWYIRDASGDWVRLGDYRA